MKPYIAMLALVLGIPIGMFGMSLVAQHTAAPVAVVAPLAIAPVPTLQDVVNATVTIQVVSKQGEEWSGSGVFIDNKGTILTAGHVLIDAELIDIVMPDGKTYKAKNPYVTNLVDVAFCQLDADIEVPFLAIAQMPTAVGDVVRVVGSPLGLTFHGTVTQGIVSFNGRDLDGVSYMQIDASAVPGNSGGPVVNLQGEIVGILVAGIQMGVEMNFVVPADQVQALFNCYKCHNILKDLLCPPQPQPQN